MRRFTLHHPDWEKVENPRRFQQIIRDSHATENVATVTVWEWDQEAPAEQGYVLKMADVDVRLTHWGIVVESSHKFDGEVRVSY